jgi:hypothetical protein
MERNAFLPAIIATQGRCIAPTKTAVPGGYGCFMYVPLVWLDDQRVLDEPTAKRLLTELWAYPDYALQTAQLSAAVALALVVLGGALWCALRYRRRKFDAVVYVD